MKNGYRSGIVAIGRHVGIEHNRNRSGCRQLNNLSIQESRLRRQRDKDIAIRELQDNRKRRAKARLDSASRQYIRSIQEQPQKDFDPAAFGFEFSLAEIKRHALTLDPGRKLSQAA